MSKTLTSSLQLLNLVRNQFEPRDTREPRDSEQEQKSYGSIRRANPTANPTARNSTTQANREVTGRESRVHEHGKLKAQFELDF